MDWTWWRNLAKCGSLEKGNGKPLQYSCFENPMNNMISQKDRRQILGWSGLPCPPPEESSQPRDWTQVSCIVDGFFTSWATREALFLSGRTQIHPGIWLRSFWFYCHLIKHLPRNSHGLLHQIRQITFDIFSKHFEISLPASTHIFYFHLVKGGPSV